MKVATITVDNEKKEKKKNKTKFDLLFNVKTVEIISKEVALILKKEKKKKKETQLKNST